MCKTHERGKKIVELRRTVVILGRDCGIGMANRVGRKSGFRVQKGSGVGTCKKLV